jgi:DNA-binding transcriptional LysR family regulator
MDRLQPLRSFTRVAELGSFTKAAESLGLPKASVSSHVRQLEDEVGVRLLSRTTRKVRLTHDGRAFYERTKDLLADVEELAHAFRADVRAVSGRIRVGLSSRMARLLVISRLPEFFEAYPQIEIELGASDRQVDLVQEGYDCVIRSGELPDSSLVGRRIGTARIANVASPAYLERHGIPRTPKDLAAHWLVRYAPGFGEDGARFEYQEGGRTRSVVMKSRIVVNSAESYAAACEAGLGIIQSPVGSLRASLDAGRLVEILPRHAAAPMPVHVLHPHRRNLPTRVRLFVEWTEKILVDAFR